MQQRAEQQSASAPGGSNSCRDGTSQAQIEHTVARKVAPTMTRDHRPGPRTSTSEAAPAAGAVPPAAAASVPNCCSRADMAAHCTCSSAAVQLRSTAARSHDSRMSLDWWSTALLKLSGRGTMPSSTAPRQSCARQAADRCGRCLCTGTNTSQGLLRLLPTPAAAAACAVQATAAASVCHTGCRQPGAPCCQGCSLQLLASPTTHPTHLGRRAGSFARSAGRFLAALAACLAALQRQLEHGVM